MITASDISKLDFIKSSEEIGLILTEIDGVLCSTICHVKKSSNGSELAIEPLAIIVNENIINKLKPL